MRLIIEGLDRLGKSTLINDILKHFGPHPIIHCSSPPKGLAQPGEYQREFFLGCFDILDAAPRIIFDRCHLGEYIYGPLYRKTDATFIFDIEKKYPKVCESAFLVLLYTTDFTFLVDDGLSLDYNAREKEQEMFIEAFNKSNIKAKYMLKINDGASYRDHEDVFTELKNWAVRQ